MIEFYNENGYLLIKNFFEEHIIEEILIDAKNIFLSQFRRMGMTSLNTINEISDKQFNEMLYDLFRSDFECFTNCGKQIQHLISLHRLSLNDIIISKIKSLGVELPVISTRPVLFFNHPNLAKEKVYHTVDAHQDWRSMQGSLNSIVVWIPLVDINSDLGALQILPKSHISGLRTDHIEKGFGMVNLTEKEQSELISIEVKTGDVLFFSSFLIHQSGTNISPEPRWSCHFRFNDLNESTFIQRKFAHPYIYKPCEELITKNFPLREHVQKIFYGKE